MATELDFNAGTLYDDEDIEIVVSVFNSAGQAQDITGWTVKIGLAKSINGVAVYTKAATVAVPAIHKFTISIPRTEIDVELDALNYYHTIWRTAPSYRVLATGKFNLTPAVKGVT